MKRTYGFVSERFNYVMLVRKSSRTCDACKALGIVRHHNYWPAVPERALKARLKRFEFWEFGQVDATPGLVCWPFGTIRHHSAKPSSSSRSTDKGGTNV